jgi:hypothetical protein
MEIMRAHDSDGKGRARRRLSQVTSLALGIVMFGTVGLSGTLAQDEDATVGITDAETMVDAIIAEIFAQIFGGDVADDAVVSGGGDLNIGGSTGSTVTMGGGSDVSIGGGGSGGGVTMGGNYGG